MRYKKRKLKLTKGERFLYTLGIIAFIFTLGTRFFCMAKIGDLKMEIEELNYKISEQSKTNESLTMQVNELTSFENVKNVVKDMGLAYNNDNIIVINE